MIEIIFRFNKKDYFIEYNESKKLKEIVENFAAEQSLDKDELFLLYKGEKVNLETELFVEEQFGLYKLESKKILKFLVFKETPFQIIFSYPRKKVILKVNLKEKMKDVLNRFALKARVNLLGIIFIYHGVNFNKEIIGEKTVEEVLEDDKSGIDKAQKLMSIFLADERSQTIVSTDMPIESINNINDDNSIDEEDDNSLEGNLLLGEGEDIHKAFKPIKLLTKNHFYIKNLLIFLIQYGFILFLTIMGFKYELDEIFIKIDTSLFNKYILGFILFFLLAFIIACLSKYKKKEYIVIFHILYAIFINYYCFILSEYIDSNYIIIGLSLITIELLSLSFNIIFKNFKPFFIVLFSFLLSFFGFVLFSFIMIKSWFPILFISIFWIISLGYYLLWFFLINKECKFDEYFYSSLIFNYGIFFVLSRLIIYVYKHIKNYIQQRINDDNEELLMKQKFYLYNFIILFAQYIFIISITIIGFEYKFNEILIKSLDSLSIKYIPLSIMIFLISILIAFLSEYKTKKFMMIFLVFYPIFLVYLSLLFSSFIESKYIMIGLSLIGLEIFSLAFNIILKNFEILHFILYSVFWSSLGLIFFSTFWIKSWFPILYISIFAIVSDGLYIFWNFAIFKLCKIKLDEFFFSVLTFNYNIILFFAFLITKCYFYIIKYIEERIDDNSDEVQKRKYFYLKNFLILFAEFAFTISLVIVGFEFNFHKIIIESDISLEIKYIPFIAFMFFLSIIIACLSDNKKTKYLIIFHIIFPFFIIYYSYLLSSIVSTKYIIIVLSLIGIQIFSLIFNIFLKKFEIKHFLFFEASLSIIGLIFFSIFWIKSLYPILFISIFAILSNLVYIGIINEINKSCDDDQFLYSSLIFDYAIFLVIIAIIHKIFICFLSRREDLSDGDNKNQLIIFGTLLGQYVIITIFVWIGFAFHWINEPSVTIRFFFSFFLIGNMIICTITIHSCKNTSENGCLVFCLIYYVPMMIVIYFFLFDLLGEADKYILSFVFIILIDLLIIFLNILLCGSSNIYLIIFSSIFANLVSIIPFHFFWLQNEKALMGLCISAILIDIYLVSLTAITNCICENCPILSVSVFNYGFFCIGFFGSYYLCIGCWEYLKSD